MDAKGSAVSCQVQQSPELSLLAAALSASSAGSLLSGEMHETSLATDVASCKMSGMPGSDPYTLFAPTNEAFEQLGIGVASSLLMPANQAGG